MTSPFELLPGFAGFVLLAWLAYLVFLAWIVRRTGDTGALRDVAEAARAFFAFGRRRR